MKGLGLLDESMSNLTSTISNETSISSNAKNESSSTTNNTMLYAQQASSSSFASQSQPQAQPPPAKKKRSLPDPEAEVIALSPKSLLATNRFVCEICKKGFQRDQNLQLHRRGHNLPWKLKQRDKDQIVRKKVYVCPEQNCVHHDPSRALGDLTGIKKHFCRKHGEKKWKCEKCSKKYAVQSDWKAHSKICGTREYRCDCGTLFSRRDSFITHRAFCDALAEESARGINPLSITTHSSVPHHQAAIAGTSTAALSQMSSLPPHNFTSHHHHLLQSFPMKREQIDQHASDNMVNIRQDIPPWLACPPPPSQPPQQISLDHGQHAGPGFSSTTSHAQLDHQAQLFTFQAQFDQNHNQGAPTLNAGPTLSSFQAPSHPQMSATALLQRAAEMGVTVSNQHQHQHQQRGNNDIDNNSNNNNQMSAGLSSLSHEGGQQQHHHHHQQTLVSNTSGGLTGEGGDRGYNSGGAGQSCSMLHDNVSSMLMNSMQTTAAASMFDSSNFGDFHHQTTVTPTKSQLDSSGGGSGKGGGGGSDGMTRDFLGLRTFSHKDFLDMAGLAHMNSSSSASFDQQQHQDHQHNQTPW